MYVQCTWLAGTMSMCHIMRHNRAGVAKRRLIGGGRSSLGRSAPERLASAAIRASSRIDDAPPPMLAHE